MITVLPAATPVTTPVDTFIVAAAVLLLVHVPPGSALLNTVVLPTQTDVIPPIADGLGCTVTIIVATHPVGVV